MSLFRSPNPHFVKIILHYNLSQRMLDLPNKFVHTHVSSLLLDKACLYLPDGGKWTVQLKYLNEKLCFLRGWADFVKFYSLEPGYFLVFKLREICCFDVLIFNTASSEIDYPIRRLPVLVPKTESEEEDNSVLIINETMFNKRQREKEETKRREIEETMWKNTRMEIEQETMFMNRRRKKKEETAPSDLKMKKLKRRVFITSSDEDENENENEEEQEETTPTNLEPNDSRRQTTHSGSASYEGDDGGFSLETMKPRKTWSLTENQPVVLKRAASFNSTTNNPSFMKTMSSSYIQGRGCLSLPTLFSNKYIKKAVDVQLEVGDERSWRLWCNVRWMSTQRRTELSKHGWKRFAKDNELKVGDICVFELMNKDATVFKVSIFRVPNA